MFGIFGKSEDEAEIRFDIEKKIEETEEAFRVSRAIYDKFELYDGDYYTAREAFNKFTSTWNWQSQNLGKIQLKLIRAKLSLIHKSRLFIASNLINQYGRPDE